MAIGILETLNNRTAASSSANGPLFRGSAPAREEREQAKVWINIGYYVTVAGENGEETRFVNLPLGMPLDTMKPVKITGQNQSWMKLQTARNGLLDEMQKLGAELKPGQTIDLNQTGGLVIQLRRADDKLEVQNQDNEFSVDLTKLMFAGTANQMAAE